MYNYTLRWVILRLFLMVSNRTCAILVRRDSEIAPTVFGVSVRLERDLYGSSIAFVIHLFDHSPFTRLIAPTVQMLENTQFPAAWSIATFPNRRGFRRRRVMEEWIKVFIPLIGSLVGIAALWWKLTANMATKKDISDLRADMNRIDDNLRAEINGVDGNLRAEINKLNEKVDAGFTRLDGKIDAGLARLNAKIDANSREHQADINKLNEKIDAGLTRLDEKMDAGFTRLDEKMDAGFARLDAKIDANSREHQADINKLNEKIDAGLTRLDEKMDAGFTRLDEKMDAGFARLDAKIDANSQAHHTDIMQVINKIDGVANDLRAEIRERINGKTSDVDD